ncbi:MAG TPA: efflux RND transporter permease subunit [Nocardioidaceae bacterium]|nr:efflux RND transporter permease subunit [Nocardioidaceae bacterium]
MTGWMVASSVRLARLIVAVAIGVLVFGGAQLRSAPVDVYPEFAPPMVQIQAEALGLSAAEVEQLVTVPLEQDLLAGVPWLDRIHSESITGLSEVNLYFAPGTDVLDARQMVQERLAQVAYLPNVGSRPVMIQPLSSTSRVMMISLSSKQLSLIDMSVLARWKVRPRLMGVPGVANVAIWGQRDRQLQVQVDPRRLEKLGVSLNQVISSTGNALWSSPLTFVEASTPGTGGFIDTPTQRFGVQHMLPIDTPRQLSEVTLEDTRGRVLRLADVANVVEGHQPLIGDASTGQGTSLMLVIEKFPGADTLSVTRDVEKAMRALAPGLGGIHIDTTVYRPASYIEASLHNLGVSGLAALGLVLLVLLLFSRSWRVALISASAILVSLVAATWVLYLRGTTFNAMVLLGLAMAVGMVVDDAVTDPDSMWRRMWRQRAQGSAPDESGSVSDENGTVSDENGTVSDVLTEAAREVRVPLFYAALVVVALLIPAFVQRGVVGAFTGPVVVSYLIAVAVSMLVALTLTPALAALLLGHGPLRETSPVARWIAGGFERHVARHVTNPRTAMGTMAALAVLTLTVIPQIGTSPALPSPKDQDLLVEMSATPSTSLQEMDRITAAVAARVRAVPGVRELGVHVGRAITADMVADVNSGELWVNLDPSADYATTSAAVRRIVAGYPGLAEHTMTYEDQQVAAAQPARRRALDVRVYGQDLATLRAQATRVAAAVSQIPGVVSPRVALPALQPTLEVRVRLADAQRHGLRPGDVRRSAATLLSGLLVGNLYENNEVFDVVVWGSPATRANADSVRHLLLDTPGGGHVRLGQVATVRVVPQPAVITHDDISRHLDVTAAVHGTDPATVAGQVTHRLQSMSFPLEYHAEVLPATSSLTGMRLPLALVLITVLVAVFLLLQAATRSWRLATLLLVTIPLGAAGGILAGLATGVVVTAGGLAGLLLVLAFTARSCLQLVSRFQAAGADGVVAATRDRLAPMLTSAAVIAAAVLPFTVLGQSAGLEILHSFGLVVLGGLVSALLLTVLVVPALYLRLARSGAVPSPAADF